MVPVVSSTAEMLPSLKSEHCSRDSCVIGADVIFFFSLLLCDAQDAPDFVLSRAFWVNKDLKFLSSEFLFCKNFQERKRSRVGVSI